MTTETIHGGPPARERTRARGTRFLEWVCAALLAAMVILLFIQVVGRYGMSSPPDWTEELARTVFAYATFVGAAVTVARNAHLKIDVLVSNLPAQLQSAVKILMILGAMVVLGVVLWYSKTLLGRLSHQPMSAVPISKAYFFAAVPIGCALMLFYEVLRLAQEVRALIRLRERKR